MTRQPARWNVLVGLLYDALVAELSVPVSYGIPNDEQYANAYVIVGGEADADEGAAGSFSQTYQSLAGADSWRRESGSIALDIYAMDGDHRAVRATTDRAFALLDEVAEILRSGIDLGDGPTMHVEIESGQVFLGPGAAGCLCRIAVTANYESTI